MLPSGLNFNETNKVEIFQQNKKAMALYRGSVMPFLSLPPHIVNIFRLEMQNRPSRCHTLGLTEIEDEDERLEGYVMADYGEFDNIADYDNGTLRPELFGTQAIKHYKLTKHEAEVLKLIAEGNHIPEIARKLFISNKTAETHSHNIKEKINVRTGYDMIRFAIRHKLVGMI